MKPKLSRHQALNAIMLFCLSLLLSACGSGGSNTAGIEGTGGTGGGGRGTSTAKPIISVGTIDELGELRVNGTQYDTDNTVYTIDNKLGTEADLAVGQVVVVTGVLQEDTAAATASEISFNTNLLGPVETIDFAGLTFSLLGQTVKINATTSFYGIESFSALTTDHTVQVSGYINSKGETVATWINTAPPRNTLEVVGPISQLNIEENTFKINKLTINIENAIFEEEVLLQNTLFVKVEGTALDDDGLLLANAIHSTNLQTGDSGDYVDVEGLVNKVNSSQRFELNSIPITTTINTVYVNGDETDISLDTRLEVEGTLNDQGLVVAEKIIIIHTGPISFTAITTNFEPFVFTLQSSEYDTGLWILAKKGSSGKIIISSSDEPLQCLRLLTVEADTSCFVENTAATTWTIEVYTDELGAEVDLSVYFSRTPRESLEDITYDETISGSLLSGDHFVYRLPAGTAGSIIELSASQLSEGITINIVDDNNQVFDLFDCRLVAGLYKYCRFINDGINQWYFEVEAAVSGNYEFIVQEVTPIELTTGETIIGSTGGTGRTLYHFDVNTNVDTVAALLNSADPLTTMELSVDEPFLKEFWLCNNENTSISQCIRRNEYAGISESSWFISVDGEPNTNFSLTPAVQTTIPDPILLIDQDTYTATDQPAGIMEYRLPNLQPETLLKLDFTILSANVFYDFSVGPEAGEDSLAAGCFQPHLYQGENILYCEATRFSSSTEDFILELKSASVGSYEITTNTLPLTTLTSGVGISGVITDNNRVHYRIDPTQEDSQLQITMSGLSAPADLNLRSIYILDDLCQTQKTGTNNETCLFDITQLDTIYLWVEGDVGATYTLEATFN